MQKYEYLVLSLLFLSLLLLAVKKRKDLKPYIIVPCLIGAIIGPLSEYLYFRDYWHPYTLLGQSVPGIEDVIFGASFIGLTLVVYPLIFKKREWHKHHRLHVLFCLSYIIIGIALLISLVYFLKMNSVLASGIVCITLLLPLLIIRRDLAAPALTSGLFMALIAGTIYYVLFRFMFRNFLKKVWLLSNTHLGVRIFNYIPLTELIWFFTVGSFFMAFDMYVRSRYLRRFSNATVRAKT